MLVQQDLGRERWTEVSVPGLDQLDRVLPNAFVPTPVRRAASGLVDQPAPAITLVPSQQPIRLTLADRKYRCCRSHSAAPGPHLTQHFDPSQIAFAHRNPAHP